MSEFFMLPDDGPIFGILGNQKKPLSLLDEPGNDLAKYCRNMDKTLGYCHRKLFE
jgi:hypothetical protein